MIKFIAAFLVICIHCNLSQYGTSGELIIGFARFAVPIFFMISGFFSYFEDDSIAIRKYKTRIIKLVKLLILSNLLYLSLTLYFGNCPLNLSSIFDLNNLIRYFVFNATPDILGGHLWFVQALIYCYVIFLIFKKCGFDPSKLYKIIPILLLVSLIITEFSSIAGINIDGYYCKNFLLMGLPFYMLGYLINDKKSYVITISNKAIIGAILFGIVLTVLEIIFTGVYTTLYVGTIVLTISIFIFCIKNPQTFKFKIFEWIGGNLYTYIYVLHLIFVGTVMHRFNLGLFSPIIVFVITIFVSTVVYLLNKKFNII